MTPQTYDQLVQVDILTKKLPKLKWELLMDDGENHPVTVPSGDANKEMSEAQMKVQMGDSTDR